MEYKTGPTFVKDIDGRLVTGIAAVFGNVDSYGDIVKPGAFRKTIQENARRIRHLWMHDASLPPTAVIRELREVGREELPARVLAEFPDATGGLLVTRKYLDTPRGNEILAGIKAGAISEMSFAYDVGDKLFKEIPDGNGGKQVVRLLLSVVLYEVSDVLWGANGATVANTGAAKIRRAIAERETRLAVR